MGDRIEPFEIVKIGTGKRVMPPYMETYYGDEVRAVMPAGLKKDGTPSAATRAGNIFVFPPTSRWMGLSDYIRYNEAQEAQAGPLRAEVARCQAALKEAEDRLLALYRQG